MADFDSLTNNNPTDPHKMNSRKWAFLREFEDNNFLIQFNLFGRGACQDVKHSKALQMKLPIHLVKSKHLIGFDRNGPTF